MTDPQILSEERASQIDNLTASLPNDHSSIDIPSGCWACAAQAALVKYAASHRAISQQLAAESERADSFRELLVRIRAEASPHPQLPETKLVSGQWLIEEIDDVFKDVSP